MRERFVFDYAIVRVVPRVDRGEFLNVGVILFCPTQGYLETRIALDRERLLALDASVELGAVETHLSTIPRVCAGDAEAGTIGALPQRARFHWLVAPRSTVIQTSPVHTGRCDDPAAALDHLVLTMVEAADIHR